MDLAELKRLGEVRHEIMNDHAAAIASARARAQEAGSNG